METDHVNYDVHVFRKRDGQWCARITGMGPLGLLRYWTVPASLNDTMEQVKYALNADQAHPISFRQDPKKVLAPTFVRFLDDVTRTFRVQVEKAVAHLGLTTATAMFKQVQQVTPNEGLPMIDILRTSDPTLVLASVFAERGEQGGFNIRIVYYEPEHGLRLTPDPEKMLVGGSEHDDGIGGPGHQG